MKVLVADDDKVNLRIVQTFLTKWGCEVVVAKDGTEAWTLLQQEGAPMMAILDWMMPGMDGLQICREVRRIPGERYTYLILLTAKFQKQDILDGFEAGADDYLTKPLDSNELRARLRAGLRILELYEQLRQAHAAVQFQATHDVVTGLWNRAAILEAAHAELSRTQRDGSSVNFVMADLDHFKQVNDRYGHLAGDVVLREAAQRMQSCLRPYDRLGRYGGEEFLIVVPGEIASSGRKVAERLRQSIAQAPVETPEGRICVTVSLGVAGSAGAAPVDVEQLLRLADTALYRAKQLGRNRVELAAMPTVALAQAEDRQ